MHTHASLTPACLLVLCVLVLQPIMWRNFMANPVMALWRKYFSFAVCYEELLDPSQHYLFADYPHGAFPLSQLLALTVRHLASWQGRWNCMALPVSALAPLSTGLAGNCRRGPCQPIRQHGTHEQPTLPRADL